MSHELDITFGLDGTKLSSETLSAILSGLDGANCSAVSRVDLVSENRFPTSQSAVLSLSFADGSAARKIFLKKVSALAMANKPWQDLRRSLAYARTESRFYNEIAPKLIERGVSVPRVAACVGSLHVLGEDSEVHDLPGEEPSAEELAQSGALLYLECAGPQYSQLSPVSHEQAISALTAAAKLHASCWEDVSLLTQISKRLQRHGGSFSLSIRNPEELTKLRWNWERFVEIFKSHDPELFAGASES